jgi:hypothetical protein
VWAFNVRVAPGHKIAINENHPTVIARSTEEAMLGVLAVAVGGPVVHHVVKP